MSVTITGTIVHPTVGNNDGSIDVTVSGGSPPYIYTWASDPPGFYSTVEDVSGLFAGTYIVTVYDGDFNELGQKQFILYNGGPPAICFHPDSQLLVNGQYKMVQDIVTGDQLFDDNGRCLTVKQLKVYQPKDTFCQVTPTLWITKKHLLKSKDNNKIKQAKHCNLPIVKLDCDRVYHIETDGPDECYFISVNDDYCVEVLGQAHPKVDNH